MQADDGVSSGALDLWNAGKYAECKAALKAAQGSEKSSESTKNAALMKAKAEHNLALADFATKAPASAAAALLKHLAALLGAIEEELMSTAENPGNEAASKEEARDPAAQGKNKFQPDAAFVLYNQAVVYLYMRKWKSALDILEDQFRYIDALEEGLALCICFLLLDVYTLIARGTGSGDGGVLLGHITEKAQSVIDYLEKPHSYNSSGSTGRPTGKKEGQVAADGSASEGGHKHFSAKQVESIRKRLTLFKYKLVLIQASISSTKSDTKSAGDRLLAELDNLQTDSESPDQARATDTWLGLLLDDGSISRSISSGTIDCLKANMEFLNGNYANAQLLLRTAHASGGIDDGLYWNNLGCLHRMLGQHNCATLFFSKALEYYSKLPVGRAVSKCIPDVAFNLGVQLLHCGKPYKAYEAFSVAANSSYNRPRLWLHIAECVVMSHSMLEKSQSGILKNVLGQGSFRRILLSTTRPGHSLVAEDSAEDKPLPLHVGLRASSQLLFLLNKAENESIVGNSGSSSGSTSKFSSMETSSGMGTGTGNGGKNAPTAASIVKAKPSEEGKGSDLDSDPDQCRQQTRSMRLSALLCRSYIALLMENWSLAYESGMQAIAVAQASTAIAEKGANYSSSKLDSNEVLAVAHSYCAEALLHLNLEQTSEASSLHHIMSSMELEFSSQGKGGAQPNSHTKAVLGINMALVRVIQGQLEEAERLVQMSLEMFPDSPHALRLLVYLYLQRGDQDRARRILKTSR